MPHTMISAARRDEIRRTYRGFRAAADKTQMEMTAQARIEVGRYWKIENGWLWPEPDERVRIARVLRVNESDLPSPIQPTDIAQRDNTITGGTRG